MFGALFSCIRQTDQIPSAVRAYEDLRQQRVRDVEPLDQRIATAVIEPDVLRQRMLEIRAGSDPESDGDEESVMRREFDSVSKVFCYDCLDAANVSYAGYILASHLAHFACRSGGRHGDVAFSAKAALLRWT